MSQIAAGGPWRIQAKGRGHPFFIHKIKLMRFFSAKTNDFLNGFYFDLHHLLSFPDWQTPCRFWR